MPRKDMNNENFEAIADRFRVMGESLRLKILFYLGDDELSVGEVARRAGVSQPTCSRHLATLLVHGMVQRRREGTTVFYRVADPSIFQLCDAVCGSLERVHQQRGRALG